MGRILEQQYAINQVEQTFDHHPKVENKFFEIFLLLNYSVFKCIGINEDLDYYVTCGIRCLKSFSFSWTNPVPV